MKRLIRLILSAALTAAASAAHAGTITVGSAVVTNPDHTIDFERENRPASNVTNQFSSEGVTFTNHSGQAPVWFAHGQCSPSGLEGNGSIAFGVTSSCGVAGDLSTTSLVFGSDVQELSFLYVANNPSRFVFEALLDGNVVSFRSVQAPSANPYQTSFLFSGATFDTLRIRETGSGSDWFWMDRLSWREAPQEIPEPGSLALLAFGLAGIARARRKRS